MHCVAPTVVQRTGNIEMNKTGSVSFGICILLGSPEMMSRPTLLKEGHRSPFQPQRKSHLPLSSSCITLTNSQGPHFSVVRAVSHKSLSKTQHLINTRKKSTHLSACHYLMQALLMSIITTLFLNILFYSCRKLFTLPWSVHAPSVHLCPSNVISSVRTSSPKSPFWLTLTWFSGIKT